MQGQTMRARDNNSMDSSKREMIFFTTKENWIDSKEYITA
jgi:hypothetical protein